MSADGTVQRRRDTKAAKRLLTRLMKKQGMAPKRIVTDKLPSYVAARRQVMPKVEHRARKGLNNRAENSHVPLRKRERMMQGFRLAEICNDSRASFQSPEICSFHPVRTDPPLPPTFTVYKPWRHGRPPQAFLPESNEAGLGAASPS